MKKVDAFDVLIVYSSRIAKSAANSSYTGFTPFPKGTKYQDLHNSYAYLLTTCAKNKRTAAFTTSDDITGPGICKSYWLFTNSVWIRVNRPCTSNVIFDKFFPKNPQLRKSRNLMFSSDAIVPFSNITLFDLFSDKLSTYETLGLHTIPTVNVESADTKDILFSLHELRRMTSLGKNRHDFSDSVILKDRFGGGGHNIYKIDTNHCQAIKNILIKNRSINFVLQPYVKFDKGMKFSSLRTNTEIRLIFLGTDLIQTYFRSARKDGFMCNEGQGGVEVQKDEIPKNIMQTAACIVKQLNEKSAFYALDFIVSNSGMVFLLEGNISPGIDWNKDLPENEVMNKKIIDVIAGELSRRVTGNTATLQNTN